MRQKLHFFYSFAALLGAFEAVASASGNFKNSAFNHKNHRFKILPSVATNKFENIQQEWSKPVQPIQLKEDERYNVLEIMADLHHDQDPTSVLGSSPVEEAITQAVSQQQDGSSGSISSPNVPSPPQVSSPLSRNDSFSLSSTWAPLSSGQLQLHCPNQTSSSCSVGPDAEIIIQAFKFVKLDDHLESLNKKLADLQQSHVTLQENMVKQELHLDVKVKQMRDLEKAVSAQSSHYIILQDRLDASIQSLEARLEKGVERIIESTSTSSLLLAKSKETTEKLQNLGDATKQALNLLGDIQTELGDVGQASIQAVQTIHKSEETVMEAISSMENRTFYALRHQVSSQSSSPSHLLADGRIGNSFQLNSQHHQSKSALEQTFADSQKQGLNSSTYRPSTKTFSTFSPPSSDTTVQCLSRKILINDQPRDCAEVQLIQPAVTSGVYAIYPFKESKKPVQVFCDFGPKDMPGWTLLQRRDVERAQDTFAKTWKEYEMGFGSPLLNSYWLGLSAIASLTSSGDQMLNIELTDWNDQVRTANYQYFRIDDQVNQYRLHVADYSGTAGDSLSYHNNMMFSTKDRDNDQDRTNCANRYQSGWWFKNCQQANLNGHFSLPAKNGQEPYGNGISWPSWQGHHKSLKKVVMRIRPRY